MPDSRDALYQVSLLKGLFRRAVAEGVIHPRATAREIEWFRMRFALVRHSVRERKLLLPAVVYSGADATTTFDTMLKAFPDWLKNFPGVSVAKGLR
jgi:hypothetical protein